MQSSAFRLYNFVSIHKHRIICLVFRFNTKFHIHLVYVNISPKFRIECYRRDRVVSKKWDSYIVKGR